MNSMDSKIVGRYFANIYSRKDFFNLKTAFGQKGENLELEEQFKDHWMDFNEREFPDVQLDHLLDKIQHRIYLEQKSNRKVVPLLQIFQRVAAILFIPLLLASLIYNFWNQKGEETNISWVQIQCPPGVRTKFQLPDGSTGFLNSGSLLTYPTNFAKERNITLSGEGYFDVVHNEKSPFHVITKNLDIKVLGTTFDVVAYDNEDKEEIILQTGHIEVSDKEGTKLASLIPDQKLVLNKIERKYNIEKISSGQYIAWKEGKLMFRNENIENMAIRISRWYNVDVVVDKKHSDIGTYTYHGTFVDEHLDDVLKLLSLSSPIRYVEPERKVDKDGNFTKRKVILSINPNKIKEFE
jgi:ferric-dicitrate binding protein FerR (iron transport regulator)